ncbi:MAG TPA: hypothetical protein VHS99_24495 [Chloroflexota bacterium]|nr:hypothetical protein [Chloroflexota bacterium]
MGRFLLTELPRVFLRLAAALIIYQLISAAPWPAQIGPRVGIVASAALVTSILLICGKLLCDTFYPLAGRYPGRFYPGTKR